MSLVESDGPSHAYFPRRAFDWEAPLRVGGIETPLVEIDPIDEKRGFDRFENPFARAAFGATDAHLEHAGEALDLQLAPMSDG